MNKQMVAESMGLKGEDMKGNVKLEGVKTEDGVKWLALGEMVESPLEINETNLGKSKSGKFTAKGTELSPVDVANPSDKSESTRDIHAVFAVPTPEGSTAEVTVDHVEKRTSSVVLTRMASTRPAASEPAASGPATRARTEAGA